MGELFKEGAIGQAEKYEATFPFVRKDGNPRVIKPIHFREDKPSALIDQGNYWLSKVQQLAKYKFIEPQQVLFAYDAPKQRQFSLFDPFDEVKEQAEKIGVVMADITAKTEIANFASH